MNWRIGTPPRVNRHLVLHLDDLDAVNGDLLSVAKELLAVAEAARDDGLAQSLFQQVDKLSDLSRRLSLATRSIAHTSLALAEAS